MKRIIILAITTLISLCGLFAVNAQTQLKGRYVFEGQKDKETFNFMLKFEGKDSVFYSYAYNGYGTLKGNWTAENGFITVSVPNNDSLLVFKLKQNKQDLEVTETLQHSIIDAGDVFKKLDDSPNAPELNPQEIGKRVISLLKSLHSLEDISPKNIEKQTGIKVEFNEKDSSNYGFGGNVTGADDWSYNFNAYASEKNKQTNRLDFFFNYQLNEPTNPDMITVCKTFNFDNFSQELQQNGFSVPQARYSVHNRLSGWEFNRGKISILVSVQGGWKPNIDNCIKSIYVTFE